MIGLGLGQGFGGNERVAPIDPLTLSPTGAWLATAAVPWVKSAGSYNLVSPSSPTADPSIGTAVDGYSPARFNGTTSQLQSASPSTLATFISVSAFEIISVVRPITTKADPGANLRYTGGHIAGDSQFGGYLGVHCWNEGYSVFIYNAAQSPAYRDVLVSASNMTTNLAIVSARLSGGTMYISVNGGSASSVATLNVGSATTTFAIGRTFSASSYLNGDVFDTVVWNSALTDARRAGVVQHFKNKYPSQPFA